MSHHPASARGTGPDALTSHLASLRTRDPPFSHQEACDGLIKASFASADLNLDANNERKAIGGHTQQNQLTINSLPPEVLYDIFLPVAGFYLGHYTRLLRLRVVCKYWKEVIDSTPGLWMAIKLELHPELQAMIIRNSRNHPLNVLWDETIWNNDPAKKAKIAAFSTLMEPSASRWQSLNYRRGLTSETSTQSICPLLDSMETSSLQGFAVAVQYHVEPEDCTPLCESAARYIGAFPLPQDNEREIEFGLRRRRIAIRNDTWDHGNGPQDRLAYLASVTNSMDSRACREVKILDLSCREHEEIGGYLRTIHSRFPQINQILLKEKQTDIAVAFQHLSSPLQVELAEEWLLPKLTKLELDLGSSTDARLIDIVAQLVMKRKAADGVEDITELRITSAPGAIGPGMVELFQQSIASFELTELGLNHVSNSEISEDFIEKLIIQPVWILKLRLKVFSKFFNHGAPPADLIILDLQKNPQNPMKSWWSGP
ncbi:hypothetical protein M407DRAFT_3968 [Tulasnella calospora MUT 4182]|uniref:F-box domain-containing protein n=1 Tax=Tulasnella calospora MUT 4182 TaxID=1051891 RepID=A0A0C3QV62_9AGAM|nr:hypothetical protein M407DRAFT_3968 [Tulasnella calospora MUT 4182]